MLSALISITISTGNNLPYTNPYLGCEVPIFFLVLDVTLLPPPLAQKCHVLDNYIKTYVYSKIAISSSLDHQPSPPLGRHR